MNDHVAQSRFLAGMNAPALRAALAAAMPRRFRYA
jgi:hypothetical protein